MFIHQIVYSFSLDPQHPQLILFSPSYRFASAFLPQISALAQSLDVALTKCANSSVSNGFLEDVHPSPGLLCVESAFELLMHLDYLVPRAQLIHVAAAIPLYAEAPPEARVLRNRSTSSRGGSVQRPPTPLFASRKKSPEKRPAPRRAPAAFEELDKNGSLSLSIAE